VKNRNVFGFILLCAFLVTVTWVAAQAAFIRNMPQRIVQPNGYTLNCFASGDEYYHWLHDKAGYVIVQDPKTSYYTYGIKVDGDIVPSEYVVGEANLVTLGLTKNIRPSSDAMAKRIARIVSARRHFSGFKKNAFQANSIPQKAPQTGKLNNIVIFIRFKGDDEFTGTNSHYADYDNVFNTGSQSMTSYYKEVSYNKLDVSTGLYPSAPSGQTTIVSYQDNTYTRDNLMPYSSTNTTGYTDDNQGMDRLFTVLTGAIEYLDAQHQIPSGTNIDGDNDGYVDNVCFFAKGDSSSVWADVLWPHMYTLQETGVKLNGKYVGTYNLQFQSWMEVDVLCHEMFHSLGAPDLYHYQNVSTWSTPVGNWDIMESGKGHMGAYMKYRYGKWIDSIPEITESGTYTLNPLTSSTNNCYKIKSKSTDEFFVVEYRKKTGTYESDLDGSGLLIYRINAVRDGEGNAQAILLGTSSDIPDEVYIYRPGGTRRNDGTPTNANYGVGTAGGKTSISDSTSPSCFLSLGGQGGLNLSNVGTPGATISFDVNFDVATPTITPAGGVYASPTAITMACATPGATIHYTLDGSVPTLDDPLYSSQITVDHSMVVSAKAFRSDLLPSAVHTESYTLGVGNEVTTGSGTGVWDYPLRTSYSTARTESLYTQSELGASGSIKTLALDVTTRPGRSLTDFTIRVKPTTASSFSAANWGDTSGWTTVYSKTTTIAMTGWNTFILDTPFEYDGIGNLIVDMSFKNDSYTRSGLCNYTLTGANRTLVYSTNTNQGNPTTWTGTNPQPALSANVANLKLITVQDAVAPVVTITSPSTDPKYSTDQSTVNISGTASDESGLSGVYWVNETTGSHGKCTQSPDWENWSVNGVVLVDGVNQIQITGTDTEGNAGSDTIDVSYSSATKLCVVIDRAEGQKNPTGLSPIKFTATFNANVSDFQSADITLSGLSGTYASVSGSGKVYTITVAGMSQSGNVTVSIPANSAHDGSGKGNQASYNLENTIYFDKSSVTATISTANGQLNPATTSPVNFAVAFSKSVVDFDSTDLVVTSTSGENLTTNVTGSDDSYNVAISGMTKSTLITVSLPAAAVHDASGNANLESTGTDNQVLFSDGTGPAVTINQAASQADPTPTGPINFAIIFDEPVENFNASSIDVVSSAGETLTITLTGSGKEYNAAISGMTKQSTITASVEAGAVQDIAGNISTASTSTDNHVTYDNVAPAVTVNQAAGQSDPTTNSPINFTAIFSEPVVGFGNNNVTIGGSAGADAAVVTGSGTTYNIAVSGMKFTGDVNVSILANAVHDAAGNGVSHSTSSDNVVIYSDGKPLNVTVNQAAAQRDPISSGPILFTVVFSKPVTDFIADDVHVVSTTGGTISKSITGSGTTYTVSLSGMSSPGKLTVTVLSGVAHDAARIPNAASTSTDNTVDFNNVRPTVTIEQAQSQKDPTNGKTLHYTAVFSTAVTGFDASDILLTGTAVATTAGITDKGDSKTFDVAVTGMQKTGTVVASVRDGVVEDIAGNTNTVSTSADNTILYDITPPVVKIVVPTDADTFVRNSTELSLSGTAEDESGAITKVTWSCYPVVGSGDGVGTANWKVEGIVLNPNTENTVQVHATDAAGNVGDVSAKVTCVITSPADIWKGIMMVSIPLVPDYTDPKVVVGFKDDLWTSFEVATNRWSMYPAASSYFNPRTAAPGRGFWTSFPTEYTHNVVGCVPQQGTDATIKLVAGWNLIGQPFILPVTWSLEKIQVKVGTDVHSLKDAKFLGWVSDYAWGWKQNADDPYTGEYQLVYDSTLVTDNVGVLLPWRAYWIKANVACDLILPHPVAQ